MITRFYKKVYGSDISTLAHLTVWLLAFTLPGMALGWSETAQTRAVIIGGLAALVSMLIGSKLVGRSMDAEHQQRMAIITGR